MDDVIQKHYKETCMACGQSKRTMKKDLLIEKLTPVFYDLNSLRLDISGKPVSDGVERITSIQNAIGRILDECGVVTTKF